MAENQSKSACERAGEWVDVGGGEKQVPWLPWAALHMTGTKAGLLSAQ